MSRKLTQEEVLSRFHAKHGDKYIYPNFRYRNLRNEIDIYCTKHDYHFKQSPEAHIAGTSCPFCKIEAQRGLVAGVGINDCLDVTKNSQVYTQWASMLSRCYSEKQHLKHPAYCDCSVCDEWHYLSNFKRWFDENYVEGFVLDKDILVKGNKVYSPDTCCFVPQEINNLLTKANKIRGEYPIGVSKQGNSYKSLISIYGKPKVLGCFPTIEDAFTAYKEAKEQHVKVLADRYFKEGLLGIKPYNALLDYRVEITD